MESYQGHMKDVLFIRQRNAHEKRFDETLHTITIDVCISYWYKGQKKIAGIVKNTRKDKHVCNAIIQARNLISVAVTWPYGYAGPALVPSQTLPEKRYFVN
jgi:hypothetical protein